MPLASYPPLATSKYSFSVHVDGPHLPKPVADDEETQEALDALAREAPLPDRPESVELQLSKLQSGLQPATLKLTTVGTYYVSVLGADETLLHSQRFPVVVEGTTLMSRYCQVLGKGLTAALAGKSAQFLIRALDRHGNAC